MKTRHLHNCPVGRLYYLSFLAIALFIHTAVSAQSETNNFITYDTVFRYNTAPTTPTFTLRISRPANMFTPGHPDTASRPAIITMPGSGEVGTNPAFLGLFGPHYWLNNGWNGAVQLGNGTHYPILITIITSATNVRPQFMLQLMDHILNTYHIKRNSVHVAGLSMGGFTWGRFITYAATAGDETAMSMVTSYTALQGIAYDNFNGVSWGLPGFGHWAKKYNGKFFGLEGTNDTRNVWSVRDAMDDSLPGNGYFSYENYGGGNHCCWNTMYNPSITDWRCVAPITNSNLIVNSNHANSMGTYQNPGNIFQWMLRQGDTTLVGNGTGTPPPTVSAGTNQVLQLPLVSISLNATATAAPGNTIVATAWTQVSGPSAVIVSAGNLATLVIGINTAGTYVFSFTATDNLGVSASSTVTVVVNPLIPPPPPPPPPPVNNRKQVGQGEYQVYFIDDNKHLWGLGNVSNIGVNNIGVQGVPQRVLVTPFDLKFKQAAGGLHGGGAIDTAGNVWIMGDNDQAQMGLGHTTHPIYLPQRIMTDSAGNPFTNVKSLTAFFLRVGGNGFNGWYAIKDDGTLWVWGAPMGGMRGKGTDGTSRDSLASRPEQIVMPGNRLVKQVVAGGFAIALCTDGTVWTWGLTSNSNLGYAASGSDYTRPRQLTQLANIEQIAGGIAFNYALRNDGTLFGWGAYGAYMGEYVSSGGGAPKPTPVILTNIMNNLPAPITKIVTNTVCTHVILADSTLWGWGDNAQGNIGNGQSLDWANFPTPWAWNYGSGQLLVQLPYHVAPTRKFVDVFGSSVYTFYTYALDKDGQLYCWGRNKGSTLANRIRGATSAMVAAYSNAWDIKWPKPVNPFAIPSSFISTSPYCIINAAGTACNTYTIPANTKPIANAGPNQSITTSSTTLNGTASTDNVYIPYYEWKQVTGPNTAVMDLPGSATPRISNLVTGTYIFRLVVTDNGWFTDSATVNITVNGGPLPPNQAPVANAGPDRAVTLPTSNTTLTGSATDADGSIAGFQWVQIAGNAVTIASPTNALTVVNGFTIAGTYQFELTVTDNIGATDKDTVVVVVSAANQLPVANAGIDQTITLPVTTVTLTGTATDPDGTIASQQWTRITNTTGTVVSPTQLQTGVNNLTTAGTYDFELRVTDNAGGIDRDTVRVTVNPAIPTNQPPVANAGNDQVITLPVNSVTVTGSGTDSDGTIAGYQWTKLAGGPTNYNIVSPTQAQTVINALEQGTYQFELRVTDNLGAIDRDTVVITVNAPGNIPPVANAGPDQTITLPTNSVTVTGSGTDSDGTIASYQWTKLAGGPTNYNIVSPTQAQTVINTLEQGTYQFELRVTDNLGAIGRDTITIIVNAAGNIPPVANAGSNQTIQLPASTVTLNGSATDADGNVVSYQWTKLPGGPSNYTIVSPTQAQTQITGLTQGVYQFELRVTDNSGDSGRDTVTVTVLAANIPPVANAGVNQNLTLPTNSTTLTGSGTDADGTIAGYLWTKLAGGPANYTIVSPTQAQTAITGLVQGTYQFELRVTDNQGAIGRDTVTINVNGPSPNQPPVANAGPDRTITLPVNTVTFTGSGTDADGSVTGYIWRKISGPAPYTIVSATQPQTVVNGLDQGVYEFELLVTDNLGGSDRDTVRVTVNPPLNQPPIADAGPDRYVTMLVNSATLDGTGSTDPGGSIVSYQWTWISGPVQYNIITPTQSQTEVTGLEPGVYYFELRVTDNQGATDRDTVMVDVKDDFRKIGALVYPNPATAVDHINLSLQAAKPPHQVHIWIYDARGIVVHYEPLLMTQRTITKQIDITKLMKGFYIVKVSETVDNTTTVTFVKQ